MSEKDLNKNKKSKKALAIKAGLFLGALLVIAAAIILSKLAQPNAETALADLSDEPSLIENETPSPKIDEPSPLETEKSEMLEEATFQPVASDNTEVAEIKAPETKVPETEVPETKVPETEVPETEVPETEVPETKAPETEVTFQPSANDHAEPLGMKAVQTASHALKYIDMPESISEADFAFRLGQKLIAANANPDDNFLYSPISVWLPLAALTNAADDRDKPALLAALGASGATQEQVNNYAQSILYRLTGGSPEDLYYYNPIKIANALFVASDKKVNQEFAQSFADNFLGQAFNVDFASSEAVDAINAWASEHTEGLIDRVVDSGSFNPGTIAAIANAIYYSDRWEREFREENTQPGPFHAIGGDSTASFMIREGDTQPYYEDDRIQAIGLEFETGGDMWIMLPKNETANDFLESLTAASFEDIQNGFDLRTGKLLLPRFEATNRIDLAGALEEIGISLDLSGLIENGSAKISSATQEALIKVDEKGTTAAAVTIMAMIGSVFPAPTEPFVMVCDKPFAFVLEKEGQILFMGVVNKPEA
jgi:serpin B